AGSCARFDLAMTAATASAAPAAALARLAVLVLLGGFLAIAAFLRADGHGGLDRLVAGGAREELEQQHGVVDQIASAGELGLATAPLGGLQLALREQQVAQALAVAPGDV